MELNVKLTEYSAIMTPDEVRERLKTAIEASGANATSLSRELGRSSGYLSDFLMGRKQTLAAADSAVLEKVLGLSAGALLVTERLAMTKQSPIARAIASFEGYRAPPAILGEGDLPVFAATEGGRGEMVVSTDPIEMVPRPWYMKNVKEGYAVLVTGESMEPRYSPGEIVVVNPKAALVRGKDVIVHTAREGGDFRAMVKSYMGASEDAWRLRQFNPATDLKLSKKEWPFAVRVVGRYDGG